MVIGASDVQYSRCRNRARVDVGLRVGINVTVSVPSNKVRIVIVLTKNVVKVISLVLWLSGESQTSCFRLVKVRIVVDSSPDSSGQYRYQTTTN